MIQMRMMYGKWSDLQECAFCPGTIYFITGRREIWFDAPDLEKRIQFTDSPEALDLYMSSVYSRLDSTDSIVNNTKDYLEQLNNSLHSLSNFSYRPDGW